MEYPIDDHRESPAYQSDKLILIICHHLSISITPI